eukprot:m.70842 g.70842  ORF g.70842 m.70842 type:complete len:234 (-) comp7905_c0_seq2:165-866(-)
MCRERGKVGCFCVVGTLRSDFAADFCAPRRQVEPPFKILSIITSGQAGERDPQSWLSTTASGNFRVTIGFAVDGPLIKEMLKQITSNLGYTLDIGSCLSMEFANGDIQLLPLEAKVCAAHLETEVDTLNFGDALVELPQSKVLRLVNTGLSSTRWRARIEQDEHNAFTLETNAGELDSHNTRADRFTDYIPLVFRPPFEQKFEAVLVIEASASSEVARVKLLGMGTHDERLLA